MKKTVAITGAGGFIGGELLEFFLGKGWKVIGLNRTEIKNEGAGFTYVKYALEQQPDFNFLKQADVIIHCAFLPWSEEEQNSDAINIKATTTLADFCEMEKKKFVFLSSFSAHEEAASHYGKHKYELEQKLRDKHLVIKPGLVIGKKGLFATMNKMLGERKFIPVIGNGQQPVQWIRIGELCEGIYSALEKELRGIYPLASTESISFLHLNELLARKKGKSPFFIFITPFIANLLLKIFGKKLPFTKENLDGLLQLRKFDTGESLEKIGLKVAEI